MLVASEAKVAVVFRRGPTKRVEQLLWSLDTDEIRAGQWLLGQVYTHKCGLSPDGKLLVYFAGKFRGAVPTFTAVSRPPWFTALSLWPDDSTWGGGGYFESNRAVVLGYRTPPKPLDGLAMPRGFSVRGMREGERRPGPWTLEQTGRDGSPTRAMRVVYSPPWRFSRPNPVFPSRVLECEWLGMFEVNGPSQVRAYRIVEGREQLELGRLDWADWDHDGSLLCAEDGRLFRQRPNRERVEVADLRDHRYRAVVSPPDAKRWPFRK